MVVRDVEQASRAGLEGVGSAEEHEASQAHFPDHGDGLRLEGQVTVSTIVSGAGSSRRQHQRDDPAPRQQRERRHAAPAQRAHADGGPRWDDAFRAGDEFARERIETSQATHIDDGVVVEEASEGGAQFAEVALKEGITEPISEEHQAATRRHELDQGADLGREEVGFGTGKPAFPGRVVEAGRGWDDDDFRLPRANIEGTASMRHASKTGAPKDPREPGEVGLDQA